MENFFDYLVCFIHSEVGSVKNLAPSNQFKYHLQKIAPKAVKLIQLSFLLLVFGIWSKGANAQCTCPGNLITNPSFETQDFSGWTLDTNDPSSFSFAGDGTYAVCGTYYAYFNPTSGNSTDYVAYYQNITAVAGDVVNLTVYAGVHDPTKNHELRLQFFNASNTLLSGGQIVQVDNDVDIAPMVLQQYSLSGTAPAGTSYVRVTAYCEGAWSGESISLKVDGFCMTKTSGSSCSLTGTGLNNVTCYPNGTATNPADDQIVFSLNPIGTGLGASYTVTVSSGTVTPTTATYGSTKWFRLNGGSAGAGNETVTVTDVSDGSCTTSSVITDPGSCVYSCGTNLLVNPSFEADALDTSPPTGWSCSGLGAFVAGNNMDEPDGTKYAFDNGAGTLCQDVAATTGQTFSLTFFSGSHNPSGVQTVTMRYLDSGGATLGTPATHVITFDTDNFMPQILGGPYSLSLPAAPAGTVSVRVEVSNGGLDFAKVDAFCMTSTSSCTQPSAPIFTQVAPGCSGATPLNNGTITLTAVTDGTHFGVSTLNAGTYDGPTTIATATAISLAQLIKDNIPNTGGTYIVRIFNGVDGCFIDQTITVAEVMCSASCTQPAGPTFAQVAPGCSGTTPLNNGTITLTAVTNGTHFGVSTLNAGTYDGPTTIATATAISLAQLIKDNIPNTGGTYIVRIFNTVDGCFIDQSVTVAAVTCNCPVAPCRSTTVIKN